MKISELHVGMRSVNVEGKILEISEPRLVRSRVTGRVNKVATAILADDSGQINLALWNEQIEAVQPQDSVRIENGYVTEFRGQKQLNVGRYGSLKVLK
ncbi:DNA-binding protein [Candidatus Bathyarchaeota archaeon]|nr:MAG: DNA-binding protein [Candidatus Bathyarchaeota archaeon]